MATESRHITEYQPSDWVSNVNDLVINLGNQRSASDNACQLGRAARIETDLKTKNDQLDSNIRLTDRIEINRRWRKLLEITKDNLDEEIKALSEAKENMEHQLEDKYFNEDVTNECLNNRDSRRGIENVYDKGQEELKKEQSLIAECMKILQEKIQCAFEQLCHMQDAREDFFGDLLDKTASLEIDITQYNMNEKSPYIGYKPNPTRKPGMSSSPQEWDDFSRYNINRSKIEINKGQRVKEELHHTSHKVDNMLDTQRERCDIAINMRIHELEQAINELDYEKNLTEKEREKLLGDIKALEESSRAKIPSLKLAETRLENRFDRPRIEQCKDAAQEGLMDEVDQLSDCKKSIDKRLANARNVLDAIDKRLSRVNDNLNGKRHALFLENMTMDYRQRLKTTPITRNTCNMIPSGIVREKSVVVR